MNITKKNVGKLIAQTLRAISGYRADVSEAHMFLQLAIENGDAEVKAIFAAHPNLAQRMADLQEARIAVKTKEKDLYGAFKAISQKLDPQSHSDDGDMQMESQAEQSD